MRKYLIIITLFLTLFFTGCNNISNQSTQSKDTENKQETPSNSPAKSGSSQNKDIGVNEQANGERGIFYLSMSRQDVIAVLKDMKIDTSNEVEITSHPEAWNYGNKLLFAGGYSFEFDKEYKLYEIRVQNDVPTTLGLKQGDSIDNMEKLYGKNYNKNRVDNSILYSYKIGDHYFWVYFEKDKVKMWGIHRADIGSAKSQQQMSSNVSNDEIDKRKEVKDTLLSEFKSYISKIEGGDSSNFNLIMAADRYKGLKKFSTSSSEAEYINEKYNKINERIKNSIIYSGYSSGGVHFIAIISPIKKENEAFKDAVNKIRLKEDEYDYLSYIPNSSDGRVLYLGVDLYAEDLIDKKKEIKIDKIFLSNTKGDKQIAPSPSSYFTQLLAKYNRKLNNDNILQNKSWNTFVFDGTLLDSSRIVIEYEKETMELFN